MGGITDEWLLSVCLFHAMFGGECDETELMLTTNQQSVLSADGMLEEPMGFNARELLGTWQDPFDGPLYAVARDVFQTNLRKYNLNRTRCNRMCSGAMMSIG